MKQTLFPISRFTRTGSYLLGLTFLSLTALAQEQPTDSIRTSKLSRGLDQQTENLIHLPIEQLNKGLIIRPDQLMAGKVAGLRVMPGGGQPGGAATISLHAISTAFGHTDPLILLDGMPLEKRSASRHTDFLNAINPEDIASISFIKDAAGVAVYGGRAANGIIYITSKRSGKNSKTRLNYGTTVAVSELRKKADILSTDEFRKLVQSEFPERVELLSTENTDWQDVIFRKAISQDHNLSLSGSLFNTVPFRVSAGHLNQQGILKTSGNKRNTVSLSVNPILLNDHLEMHFDVRASQQKLRIADTRAITTAWAFDPTQPVFQSNKYGGYITYLNENGDVKEYATDNPLSLLEQRHDQDNTNTIQGQAQLKYKVQFLPALSVHMRYGFLHSNNEFQNNRSADMASVHPYTQALHSDGERKAEAGEIYFTYDHPSVIYESKISLLAGASSNLYSNQFNLRPKYSNGQPLQGIRSLHESQENSFFGKMKVIHKDKYTFEASVANEKHSNLPAENEALLSYGLGITWDVLKESFMADNAVFSSLKLYTNFVRFAGAGAQDLNNTTLVNSKLQPESIHKWQVGTSFGLLNDRLRGNLSYLQANSDNMFMLMQIPRQTGYIFYLTNGGSINTKGLEANLNYKIIAKKNLSWDMGSNLSYSRNEVNDLPKELSAYYYNDNFVLTNGKPVNTFSLFEHVYDSNGKPMQGNYVMKN